MVQAKGELAHIRMLVGDFNGAAQALGEAISKAGDMGASLLQAQQRARLGRCLVEMGRQEAAMGEIEASLTAAIQANNPELEAIALLRLVELNLSLGDGEAAVDHLEELEWNEAMAHNKALQIERSILEGRAASIRRDISGAHAHLAEARESATRHDFWPLLWEAARCSIALTRQDERSLGEAAANQLPQASAVADARLVLAELYARVEDDDLITALKNSAGVKSAMAAFRR